MITKTVRSRFQHEVGEKVEGCTILEVRLVIPPQPSERRLGVYDYVVEVPPVVVNPRESHGKRKSAQESKAAVAAQGSFTRTTPEEMGNRVIRRVPSR